MEGRHGNREGRQPAKRRGGGHAAEDDIRGSVLRKVICGIVAREGRQPADGGRGGKQLHGLERQWTGRGGSLQREGGKARGRQTKCVGLTGGHRGWLGRANNQGECGGMVAGRPGRLRRLLTCVGMPRQLDRPDNLPRPTAPSTLHSTRLSAPHPPLVLWCSRFGSTCSFGCTLNPKLLSH